MKITESKIRQYIHKLLMETFYVQPDGVSMTRDQFARQRGNEGIKSSGIPDDAPGVVRSFPVMLAREAKEEYENMQLEQPKLLDMIEEKALSMAFGFAYDELLDNLTFTASDLKYVNMDINQSLKDKTNFNQGLMLVKSLMPKTHAYLKHITAASDDFSLGDSEPGPSTRTHLSPSGYPAFTSQSLFELFFKPPEQGKVGMGRSLTDVIVNNIVSAMSQVKNQTPVEFADQHYATFESVVNKAFKNNPIIANNAQTLEPYRKGYLDSIMYVLREIIGEINFEFIYSGWGSGPKEHATSTKPEDVMVFLPDDREMVDHVSNEVIKYLQSGKNRYTKVEDDYHWLFPDVHRDGSYYKDEIPELRSMPSYYDTKFSVNPKYISYVEKEIDRMFNSRMYDNMMFGYGFRKKGIEVDTWDDEVGDKWQES